MTAPPRDLKLRTEEVVRELARVVGTMSLELARGKVNPATLESAATTVNSAAAGLTKMDEEVKRWKAGNR